MIGVAIVALMSIVASSTKASINAIIDSSMRADFVISSGDVTGATGGFSPALQEELSRLPEVATALGVRSSVATIFGTTSTLHAADPKSILELFNVGVTAGNVSTMGAHDIAVSTQVATARHLTLGSTVEVTFPMTGSQAFVVRGIFKDRAVAGDFFVPMSAAMANFPQQLDVQEYLK